MKLPTNQVAVLEATSADESRGLERVAEAADLDAEVAAGAAFGLAEAGLVSIDERTETRLEPTEEGRRYAREGLPERRLYEAGADLGARDGPIPLEEAIEASGLSDHEVAVALANLARRGLGSVEAGSLTLDADPEPDGQAAALEAVVAGDPVEDEDVVAALERRGLLERRERAVRSIRLTDEGVTALMEGVETEAGHGRLTPRLLTSGEWRDAEFAPYNVEASGTPTIGGRVHILRQTANRVKDVLVAMGFKEMAGPHVDAQFWINDCLFMPQDHPARTHWDQFALERPAEIRELPQDLLERVREAHRHGVGPDGEGYHAPWSADVARQLDLRGHTTSLSMRYLSGTAVGELDPPERYFSVEKVYRNDTLDPTHLLEFFQIEGWVMAEDLSVRDLMGTFTEFYAHFGITDLQFKPHYNPYTEPSFELFGRHPESGDLIEIGNSGMFRPEVLEPLGVDCDVMAWGLALERLLMLIYGFEDVRDVHGTLCDLELLRETEVLY